MKKIAFDVEATGGRRELRKIVTRKDLLTAGRKLFGEKGLYESRIEDITRRAGIAKGTLYRYYRNKEELVLAVVSQGFDDLAMRVESALDGVRTRRSAVRLIVEAHIAFFQENPDLMRVFHQMRGMLKFNRPEWRPLRRALVTHLDRVDGWLGRAESKPSRKRTNQHGLACFLFGGISGIASVLVASDPQANLRAVSEMSQAFVEGVRALEVWDRGLRRRARS
ncbi:MAG: TetR/AcrR family transcriptional regulator [Planctomycetes bacterium]|nr:TetR/AcrR family transcriptional regulator [Planctomycetota bacterium]